MNKAPSGTVTERNLEPFDRTVALCFDRRAR
jgi:hypothetical protein